MSYQSSKQKYLRCLIKRYFPFILSTYSYIKSKHHIVTFRSLSFYIFLVFILFIILSYILLIRSYYYSYSYSIFFLFYIIAIFLLITAFKLFLSPFLELIRIKRVSNLRIEKGILESEHVFHGISCWEKGVHAGIGADRSPSNQTLMLLGTFETVIHDEDH